MNIGIPGCQLGQGDVVLDALPKIRRPNPSRGWVDEVGLGDAPRRLDGGLDARRIPSPNGLSERSPAHLIQDHGFLRRHAHALSEYRIEPTHRVTHREQACREQLEALKMAPLLAG